MSSYLQTELKFQGMSGCNPIIYEVFFIFESWKMRNCDVWLVGVYIFLTQGLILRQVNADWLLIIKKKKRMLIDWFICVFLVAYLLIAKFLVAKDNYEMP